MDKSADHPIVDDDGFMGDAALVCRLAVEKLEAKVAELRAQWKWTKAALDLDYGELAQYARLRPRPAEVPAELAAEIDEMVDGLAVYSDKDRARAACIVTIGDDGEFELHQGLLERGVVPGAADAGEDERDSIEAHANRPIGSACRAIQLAARQAGLNLQLP